MRRPVLRWHGGKWRLAPWIIEHFPPHRVYVEAFGGAASVLLRKPRSYAEVYNDLDGEVVNLFRVLRGPDLERLVQAVRLTPFARDEFALAYEPTEDPVERARRLVARSFMGFGSTGAALQGRTGFRSNSYASNTHPAADFLQMPEVLELAARRLTGVVIENRPALQVLAEHDAPDALHYVDPPYLHELRHERGWKGAHARGYSHEMTDADHAELLERVFQLRGMVVLSGYPSPLYDEALPGWQRFVRQALADGARPRVEAIWLNPAAADALHPSLPLEGASA